MHLSRIHPVEKPLFEFMQRAFGTELKAIEKLPVTKEAAVWLCNRLLESPLTIKEAIQMPLGHKRALLKLIGEFVTVLLSKNPPTLPPDLLSGTSGLVLGTRLLRHIAEHHCVLPR